MSDPDPDIRPPMSRPVGEKRNRFRWLTLLVILPCAGAVLGLVVAVISGYVMPKKYESVALLQVNRPGQELRPIRGREGGFMSGANQTERFMETEFEVVRSLETLKRVLDRLDLSTRWNGMDLDEVLRTLQAMVRTEAIPGTDLLKIRVRHVNAQDARDIANAVTVAYRERRDEMERNRATQALNALDREIRVQEDLVEEKRKLFHTIVKAVGIPYIEGVAGSGQMGRDEEGILRAAHREEYELEKEKLFLEQEIRTMLRLEGEELLQYLVLSERSPELNEKLQAFAAKANELEVERTQLAEGDPKLRTLEKEVALLQSDLHTGVARYKEKLQTDLELLGNRHEKMNDLLERRRDDAVDKALQSQDYIEAKLDYEAAKAMLEAMKKQHSEERLALKIPKNPITIHESPMIARSPSTPKVEGLILGGTLLGAAAGLLLALPISALMVARG